MLIVYLVIVVIVYAIIMTLAYIDGIKLILKCHKDIEASHNRILLTIRNLNLKEDRDE